MRRAITLLALVAANVLPALAQDGASTADAQRVEELTRQVQAMQQALQSVKGVEQTAPDARIAELESQVRQMREQMQAMQKAGSTAPAAPAAPVPPAPVAGGGEGTVVVTGPAGNSATLTEGGIRTSTGNLVRFGGNYTVGKNEVVQGDANVFGGSLVLDGRINGDLSVMGGNTTVNGVVSGNIKVLGGNVDLGPEAQVGGGIQTLGGNLTKAEGARVGGGVEDLGGRVQMPAVALPPSLEASLGRHRDGPGDAVGPLLAVFILGALLLAAMPQRIDTIGRMFLAKPAHSFVIGLLGSLAAFVATAVTCGVGGLVTIPVMALATLMGVVAVTVILGRRVLIGRTYRSRLFPLLVGLVVWFLALFAANVIPPLGPFLFIATWMAVVAAVGAALTTGLGRNSAWLKSRMGNGAGFDPTTSYAEF